MRDLFSAVIFEMIYHYRSGSIVIGTWVMCTTTLAEIDS